MERWLDRRLMLGVILLATIMVSYLGARGLHGPGDHAVVVFAMRQRDLRIHRELRRRRGGTTRPDSS